MKGIIFDLDGTLLYTLSSMEKCTNKTLVHFGCEPQPLNAYKYFVGDGIYTLLDRAFEAAGFPDYPKDEAAEHFKNNFIDDCKYKVKPYDCIIETINALKSKGIKICCLTNKPHQNAVSCIDEYFGAELFDCIFGQKDGVPKKPDPTGAFEICKLLELKTDEVIYIGDSNVDMELGKRAGFFTVGALWGYRTKEELIQFGADDLIDKPENILKYFD